MSIENEKIKNIIEAVLFAADKPMSIEQMLALFDLDELPQRSDLKELLKTIEEEYQERGIELKQVSSGYRFQVRQQYSAWVSKLWEEKPPRYTRALLETLALITYRQPITRAEIEDVRGVAVSSNIMKTLQERGWVKIVGHRDVPGRPALFATTKDFLDYFNLKSMDELPTLAEIKDLDKIGESLGSDGEIPEVDADGEVDNENDTVVDSNIETEVDSDIGAYMKEVENEGEIKTQEDQADAINDFDEESFDTEKSTDDIDDIDEDLGKDRDEGNAEFSAVGEEDIDRENAVSDAAGEAEVGQEEASPILDKQSENDVAVTTADENIDGSIKKSASSDYATASEGTLLN